MDDRSSQETPRDQTPGGGPSGPTPKVSVSMLAYNHEDLIGEALESIFMQEVDFPYEIVIGEDCSTDGTRAVILDLDRKHPGIIQLSNYETNQGGFRNAVQTLARCRGEYVAFLDGDDYWTSPQKLQRQVDLLDSDPGLSMCFHAYRYRFMDPAKPSEAVYPVDRKPRYGLADFYRWMRCQTSTMMMRQSMWTGLPEDWVKTLMYGDWISQILLAEKGDIAYIDEVMSAYRRHEGAGYHSMLNPTTTVYAEQVVMTLDRIIEHLGDERALPYELERGRALYRLAHLAVDLGEFETARKALKRAVSEHGYDGRVARLEPMRSYVHLYAPAAYRALRSTARSARPEPRRAGS